MKDSNWISTDRDYVESMLDKVEAALEHSSLPVQVFNDDELFKAEMDRIFTSTWVFVGHVSEIPEQGDFVLRRIGLDRVILNRDSDDNINVISNMCRHRGTEVCSKERGNTDVFTCPYHGWAYGDNGDLIGAPQMDRAYGRNWDKSQHGLLKAPKVEVFCGLIFASLTEDVPPLEEFLGGAGWMLKAALTMSSKGMRVIGHPERYKVRADWKIGAENFAGDTYHIITGHQSTGQAGINIGLDGVGEHARSWVFENGHNFLGHAWTTAIHPGWVFAGHPAELLERFDFADMDDTMIQMLKHTPPTIGTIFPNLSFVRAAQSMKMTDQTKPLSVFTSIRQWQPVAPGEMEIWNWSLVWEVQTDEEAAGSYDVGQWTFGSGGVFETDDTVLWEGSAKAGKSAWARKADVNFNYRLGQGGSGAAVIDPDWKGPGDQYTTGFGEHCQLSFHRQWLKTMREGGKKVRK